MARRITRIAPAYRDTGGLRAQDNVDLDVFIGSGDRVEIRQGTPSPFFSGREAEIQAFYRTLFHFGRGSRENLTHVVEGPPGSGKSALMVQCMEEARRFEPARNGARWLTVRLPASATGSPAEFAAAVNEAITARVAEPDEGLDDRKALLAATAELVGQAPPGEDVSVREAAALIRDTINELVGATQDAFGRIAEGARLKAEKIHAAVKQSPAAKIIDRILRRGFSGLGFSVGAEKDDAHIRLHEVLRKYERTWKPYNIVLFIDEAQNIPVDSRPEHVRDFFSSIHEGTARPRLAICAFGLTGTLDKIRAAGVSRLQAGHFHILGALAQDDCRKAAHRCFEQFEVRGSDQWESALTESSGQWPQHLAGYLTAAMTHLLEHTASDVEFDASQSDLGAALAAGDKVRDWYYRDRALALRASLEWAQELAIARPDGAPATSRSEIRATLAARLGKDISEDATLRFMDRALHVGLLAPDAEDATRYVMPIPSFAAYLRRTGGVF